MKKTAIFGLLSALVFMSCDALFPPIDNPDNCVKNPSACGDGLICDKSGTQRCVPVVQSCMGPANCLSEKAAACPATTSVCTACSADNQCEAWSNVRNHTPAWPVCISGTCFECRTSTDCKDSLSPICDATSHACRPCAVDSECASGICRKKGDYPETAPVSGLQTGQCVDPMNIAYASNMATGCSATGGTMAQPFCNVTQALGSGKPYIFVQPSATYPALTVSTGNVVLIGPGRDSATPAVFASVTVNGGATLTLSGVKTIQGTSGSMMTCTANASLYVRDTIIPGNLGRGIDAEQGCAKLVIDRVRVTGTTGYGVVIGSAGTVTTQYRIVNTAVTNSGSTAAGELYGVSIGPKANGFFAFNTLKDNNRGITCAAAQPVSDSIVAGNGTANAVDVCTASRVTTSGVDFVVGPEPKLSFPSSNNSTCCIDTGQPPAQSDAVLTDYFGTDRPQGQAYDRGYHEVVQP